MLQIVPIDQPHLLTINNSCTVITANAPSKGCQVKMCFTSCAAIIMLEYVINSQTPCMFGCHISGCKTLAMPIPAPS